MIAWTLFHNPAPIGDTNWPLMLLLPLLVSVAIVYKTIRTDNVRRLPIEIGKLIAYMIGGLILLGAVLWLVYLLLA